VLIKVYHNKTKGMYFI